MPRIGLYLTQEDMELLKTLPKDTNFSEVFRTAIRTRDATLRIVELERELARLHAIIDNALSTLDRA